MKAIVAADKNWGIGKDAGLLCHIPGDLRFFKEKTLGCPVIMGRKTLESLPGGRPLSGRRNIVLTGSMEFSCDGAETAHSVEEAIDFLKAEGEEEEEEAFVIGGAKVYSEFLEYLSEVYVTKIDREFEADSFFPDLDKDGRFELIYTSPPHEENGIAYRFATYRRV